MNTLQGSIYEDRDLASEFLTRLSSCYRYIIENTDNNLVSIAKELQFLNSYLFMMEIRHEKALTTTIHDFDNTQQLMIPTLSIQMLVENALKHNVYSPEKPLYINIYKEDHFLVVKNNLQLRQHEKESTQLGLKNIQKRISYYTDTKVIVEKTTHYFIVKVPFISKS